jgi:FkbM family methyltransferase
MSPRVVVASILRTFIYAGAAFIVFEITCWIHPPMLALGLAAAGRAEICSAPESLRGAEVTSSVRDLEKSLASSASVVRRDSQFALWKTGAGDWWIPTGGESVLPGLLAQQRAGSYDPKTIRGKVVIDCGAHIGLYTREAVDYGAERIVAVEPSPDNLACLRRNVELMGGVGKVAVYPKGVWDEEKTLRFFHSPKNSAGDSFVAKSEGDEVLEEIPVTTIDKIAVELYLKSVDVIKMDIKGATVKALNGASAVVAKYHPKFVISTEEREDSAFEIVDWMKRHGYRSRCGACAVSGDMKVSPAVMFFE